MSALAKHPDLPEPPVSDLDPYSMETLENPHPFYAALRDAGPVVFLPKYGVYATGRYDEVRQVTTDWERFTSESGVGITDARDPKFRGRPPSALVEVDPPAHTKTRRVANRLMSPVIIRSWRWVFEEKAKETVDRVIQMGTFDGMRDLIEPIVFGGFPKAIGIRFDEAAIRAIGYMSFNQTGPENDLYFKGLKAGEPFMEWFLAACQSDATDPGSIAAGFFEAEAAGELDPGIASNIVRSLVRGGMDTTMSGMGSTLYHLAANPDQYELLKQNPHRTRHVFDEGLRMEAPNHVVYRCTVSGGAELSGYWLRGDTKVGTFHTAANHDPRFWKDPGKFDIFRETANIHASLGAGQHNCIGQNVARLEAECMMAELMKRDVRLELAGEPKYLIHNQLRIMESIPLRVVPA
ncbi:cytochrome P450 [Ruixingdingia sedimenti]|uniref:Cytochrome P450 n=1 Tax=Ruixingdingia sedimenti TaxID=3073604 RepID=A0ABU1F311_9RHOB|nr:cytochrome P450 [Xinfangfangia sp. LG-4]MDR5651250.1 cytochrome P450 [Xinfangfangia sp. LG-4]